MITLDDYYMGRDKLYPPSPELIANAQTAVQRANLLLEQYYASQTNAEQCHVTSGYRPPAINADTPGAAVRSKHMTCEAIDLSDPEGVLDQWCLDHPDTLEAIGLWQEHPSATKGWCHVQIVPPRSGRRVFYP